MMRSLRELRGYRIEATDGELGSVRDVFFDDEMWTVRYMVAATGPWLLGKRVLVGWLALGQPDWRQRTVPVTLTKEQVKHSAHVSTDEPVSRRREHELQSHHGWAPRWGVTAARVALQKARTDADAATQSEERDGEAHLRSLREVVGYDVRVKGARVGRVGDFLADDRTWTIRQMVVKTGPWHSPREVLVDASCIEEVDWSRRLVMVALRGRHFEEAVAAGPGDAPSAAGLHVLF
jgi:sporulation protein YlmC with PRC-barrel domain